MSQQVALTLNTLVYAPDGQNNGIVRWMNRDGGTVGSFTLLWQKFVTSVGKDKRVRVTWHANIPIVAAADSACSCTGEVLRTSGFEIQMFADNTSSAAERLDAYNRLKDLVATDSFKLSFTELNPAYA